MIEGGAEVEEWDGGCSSSTTQLTKGKQRDGRRSPFGEGTLVSEEEKGIWQGQGRSFVMIQGTPGKTVK